MKREQILEVMARSVGKSLDEIKTTYSGMTEAQWQELHRFVTAIEEETLRSGSIQENWSNHD